MLAHFPTFPSRPATVNERPTAVLPRITPNTLETSYRLGQAQMIEAIFIITFLSPPSVPQSPRNTVLIDMKSMEECRRYEALWHSRDPSRTRSRPCVLIKYPWRSQSKAICLGEATRTQPKALSDGHPSDHHEALGRRTLWTAGRLGNAVHGRMREKGRRAPETRRRHSLLCMR